MLTEFKNTRQIPDEPFRRWFTGQFMELIVWYNDKQNSIIGFQLCYRKRQEYKALTWDQGNGYSHETVDDGEGIPGRSKMTPILMPDGALNSDSVLTKFRANSENLDPSLVEFICHKISSYKNKVI